MKDNYSQLIIIILLIILIGINIVNSCKEQPDLSVIQEEYKKNEKLIMEIDKEIEAIKSEISYSFKKTDSLYQANEKTIKKYNNEISKLDELFNNNNDTLLVNAVLRFWANRLYKLQGFFQSTTPDL